MELIVLNTTKTADSSLVIHALSREYGRRSFITGVARRAPALYLPLNILEAEVVENRKSELWRLRGAGTVYPLDGLRSSLAKNSICLFMSEVLYRAVREGTEGDGLYDWCRKSILTLDALESEFSNYHLRFLLELAVCLGFSPEAADLRPFVGDCSPQVEALLRLDFASSMLLPLNGRTRGAIAEGLIRYLGFHLDYPLNIRSLPVLTELFEFIG